MTRAAIPEPYRTTLNGVDYQLTIAPSTEPEGMYARLFVMRGTRLIGSIDKVFASGSDEPTPSLPDVVRDLWRGGMRGADGVPIYLDPNARDRLVSAVLEPDA